ncbi:MAG: cell wall-active antibiotics response protein [Clostridiales bacterium]|jgi:predicted membrane protein|nr:cell wall-active antibiotics response protein [Clostridiales bacterium]
MNKRNMFWGMLLIIAAVLIILNVFGYFPGVSIFKIVLTVCMLGIIIVSIRSINFWGILFPLAIILITFDRQLNITEFTPWPVLLVAFLISLGLSMIFNRHNSFVFSINGRNSNSFGSSVVNEQDGSVVNCSTTFGECIKYVNTEDFTRANIKCSFGDVKVYFDNAKIPSGKADIYLDVSFGDVDLFIPRTWNVVNESHAFFGDMDISRNNNSLDPDAPIVTIHGNINFGDTSIIYV